MILNLPVFENESSNSCNEIDTNSGATGIKRISQ